MHIGRQSVIRTATVETTAAQITGPSPRRVALLFATSQTGRFTVSTESSVAIDVGITLQTSGGVIEFTLERHGEIVQRAWHAVAATGSTKVAFLETFEGE